MIVANWYDDHLFRLGSALCRMYMLHPLQIRSNAFGLLLSRRNTGLMVGPQSEQTPITQGRRPVMAIGAKSLSFGHFLSVSVALCDFLLLSALLSEGGCIFDGADMLSLVKGAKCEYSQT